MRVVLLPVLSALLALLCGTAPPAHAAKDAGPSARRVLVLVESLNLRATHSSFFSSLAAKGPFDLEYRLVDDPELRLHKWEEYLYDALVIFAPTTEEFGGAVDVPGILEFIDQGGDVLLAASSQISEPVREIATEVGVDFDEQGTVLHDHFGFNTAAPPQHGGGEDRSLVLSGGIISAEAVLGGPPPDAPVVFRGLAMSVSPESELVARAVSARGESFSAQPGTEITQPPLIAGRAAVMAALVQARNDARVLVAGSLEMFSNEFFEMPVQAPGGAALYPRSGNGPLLTELAAWAFHCRGLLRATEITHWLAGGEEEEGGGGGRGGGADRVGGGGGGGRGGSPPSQYRVGDDVVFGMRLEERREGGAWAPYRADDVQVEFVMLDPYVRVYMRHDGKGWYTASFRAPDVYGVFKFRVSYRRVGLTPLEVSVQVPVRPFRHDEYERFIPAAYPYYASAFSMVAGFLAFSVFYLYSR